MSESVRIAEKKSEVAKEDKTLQTRTSDYSQPLNSSIDRILFLQRTVGNQAVGRLIKSGALQAKLRIGQPGDKYEQEADRVAEQVMRMPEQQEVFSNIFNIQRTGLKCEENELKRQPINEEKEEKLQRQPIEEEDEKNLHRQPVEDDEDRLQAKEISGLSYEADADTETHIRSMKGGGKPLSEGERAFFEPRFSADFSQVRVHTDARAEEAARAVNAHAFTLGHNVVFGRGEYAPETNEGKKLLGHELTHVIQQDALSNRNHLMRQACGHDGQQANCGGGALARWRLVDIATEEVTNIALDELIVNLGLRSHFGGTWVTQVQTPSNPEKRGTDRGRVDGLKVSIGDPLRIDVIEIKSRATQFSGGCGLASREANGYVRVLRSIAPQVAAISRILQAHSELMARGGRLNAMERKILQDEGIDINNIQTFQAWRFYNSLQNRMGNNITEGFSRMDVDVNRDGTPGHDYEVEPPILVPCKTRKGEGVRIRQLIFQVNKSGGISYGCRNTQCQSQEEERKRIPQSEEQRQRQTQPEIRDQPVHQPGTDVSVPVLVGAGGAGALTAVAIAAARRRAARIAAQRLAAELARREAQRLAGQAAWRRTAEAVARRRAAQVAARGASGRLAGKAAGRAIIYGEIAAAVFLLISGRAEARAGPGQSALEALYRSMTQNGTPPSQEMRELIESDPLLRQLAEEAESTGDATPLKEEVSRRMIEMVRNNPDEFSPEDLEILLQVSGATSSSGGGSVPETTAELRAAIERARAVQRGEVIAGPNAGSGNVQEGGGREGTQEGREGVAPGNERGPEAGPSSSPPANIERYPSLSNEMRARFGSASVQVRSLFDAMTSRSGTGPRVTDEAVRRFLDIVPGDLSPEETHQLIERLVPSGSESLDEILSRLEAAVQSLRGGGQAGRRPGEGGEEPQRGERQGAEGEQHEQSPATQGSQEEGTPITREEFINNMLEVIANYSGWADMQPRKMYYIPSGEHDFANAPLQSVVSAYAYIKVPIEGGGINRAVAFLNVRIISRIGTRRGSRVVISVVSATDVVAENRRTVVYFRIGQRISANII